MARPLRGQVAEKVLREARVVRLGPALAGEVFGEELSPERGVVGGEAVEGEGAKDSMPVFEERKIIERRSQEVWEPC